MIVTLYLAQVFYVGGQMSNSDSQCHAKDFGPITLLGPKLFTLGTEVLGTIKKLRNPLWGREGGHQTIT